MIQNLKALVVVLAIAWLVFHLAKPLCLRFMDDHDFRRRRNIWLALTVAGFASPSFWIYLAVAVPLIAWGARRDRNPAALYVLLFYVMPLVSLDIPVAGINQLFQLNHQRVLALAILLPVSLRLFKSSAKASTRHLDAADWLLYAYIGLLTILLMPYESFTHTMRRAFLMCIDTVLVFNVFSRIGPGRRAVIEVIASLALSCGVMALIAAFENLRGWLLYQGIGDVWGDPNIFAYLLRGDSLRAQASAGHSLALGYVLAMGFGFTLYLKSHWRSPKIGWALAGWMWMGLLATLSRGPWLTSVLLLFLCLAMSPGGTSGLLKGAVAFAAVAALVLASPLGASIVDYLPFVGSVDSGNVEYRQQLLDTALALIPHHPYFGDPFVLNQMESLRQGQGIIDLINGYVQVVLNYGLVGLALFCGLFLMTLLKAFAVWRRAKAARDDDLVLLGATLIACMAATLFFIATASYGTISYLLAGLLASYAYLQPQVAQAAPAATGNPSKVAGRWATR